MGDRRFAAAYLRVRDAPDRARVLARLSDEETVEALAAASRANDPLLANTLATEATNRMRRLRSTLAHLGEGVITIGPDGVVRWVNPMAEKLIACARKDMIGKRLEEIVECPAASPLLRAIREFEDLRDDDETVLLRDGRRLSVSCTVTRILTEEGEPAGIAVTLADVSERKRRERALRVGEARYHSLFQLNMDAIVTMDPDGTILEMNAAAERLTGVPTREVAGRSFERFLRPPDKERAFEMFRMVAAGRETHESFRIHAANGRDLTVETIGIPIIVDDEVVGIHGIARPLTA